MTRVALLCALALVGVAAYAITRRATRPRPLTVPYEWVGAA